MSIIDETFFLTRHGQSAGDFPAGLIDAHLNDAADELSILTSETTYQEVEVIYFKDPNDRTLDEAKMLSAFQRAEAELVMMVLIPKLNVKIGREGIVTSSYSKTFGEGNFKTATPDEIEKIKNTYLDRARSLVKKYIPEPGWILSTVTTEET